MNLLIYQLLNFRLSVGGDKRPEPSSENITKLPADFFPVFAVKLAQESVELPSNLDALSQPTEAVRFL